jgi:putative FmdB family regulatory protein
MPIYEYKCVKCEHGFEHLARTASEPVPKCPKCGAGRPAKQLSVFSAAAGSHDHATPCGEGGCPSAGSCSSGGCPYA